MARQENRSTELLKMKPFFEWLTANIENLFQNESLQNQLSKRLAEVNPRVRWEIGPWDDGKCFFAFSPNLDVDLLEETKFLALSAPSISNWVFLSAKPRKCGSTAHS